MSFWRAERKAEQARAAAAVALVEALFDADDAAEESPFSVLVVPDAVRVEVERCRVAFKRARRGG